MGNNSQIWTTKDGRKINVRDMTDRHLKNTVKFLERASRIGLRALVSNASSLFGHYSGRDNMAAYYAEQEFDQAMKTEWQDLLPKIYYDMKDEQHIRSQRH